MKEKIQNPAIIGLTCYKRDQWKQLLATAEDREILESTWSEWRENAEHFTNEMNKKEMKIKEVLIDINEFNEYCDINNLSKNAETRNKYTIQLLEKLE